MAPQGAPPKAQWQGLQKPPPPFRHTPYTFRDPAGCPTEGLSGRVRTQFLHSGVPLERFVAP
eukprot:1991102-Pyramimonas_sp.AAC.1